MPSPVEISGFVVVRYMRPAPPVASTTRPASYVAPALRCVSNTATATARPSSTTMRSASVCSRIVTPSRSASEDSESSISRPVESPPECRMRGAECAPSRPSATSPSVASKRTP